MKNQLLITIVLALMLSSALSASYDYYVYTLENPGTICQSYHCDSSDEGIKYFFTIKYYIKNDFFNNFLIK